MYCDGKTRSPRGQARKFQAQYDNAKQCAKQRNIEWQFTYDEWVDWWGDDIINRGPYKGQLVMARNGDIGPYHKDNVRKATSSQNCREAHKDKPKSPEHIKKIMEIKASKKRIEKELA